LYDEVQRLDPDHADGPADVDVAQSLHALDRIDHAVTQISVPRAYTGDLYKLRRDIDLVRRRLHATALAQNGSV